MNVPVPVVIVKSSVAVPLSFTVTLAFVRSGVIPASYVSTMLYFAMGLVAEPGTVALSVYSITSFS